MEKFGKEVDIAYNVDSFGHSEGLPKILAATGFSRYVFTRPPNPSLPLFRWRSGDSMVTALRILHSYGYSIKHSEDEFRKHIDMHFKQGATEQTLFFGVGDHGGGIYRKQLEWLLKAAEHLPIRFSTLAEYFERVEQQKLPEHTGEIGPVFKGCYSACQEIKQQIAYAGERIIKAEKLGASASELQGAWRELLFEHFHDVLPGTSTLEAVKKDILPGLGSVIHSADYHIDRQLARRNAQSDTSFMAEGGIQVWNPHPSSHQAIVSFDGFCDPNNHGAFFDAFTDANGNSYPLQYLPAATTFGPCGEAWQRFTAVIPAPPSGESYLAYSRTGRKYPDTGFERQRQLLPKLSFPVFFDNTRTWGFGLDEFAASIGQAEMTGVSEYQNGPVCSILRTLWRYGNSKIILDIIAYQGIEELSLKIRLDWHEIRCCLKLAYRHGMNYPSFHTGQCAAITQRMPSGATGAFEQRNGQLVPMMPTSKEAAMIDFCAAVADGQSSAFFCSDLHSCDHAENQLRITLCRPVLYADHAPFAQSEEYGWTEQGVSWRELWLLEPTAKSLGELPLLAQSRLINSEIREVSPHHVTKVTECPPLPPSFQARTTVLNSARYEGGKHRLSLCNYGEKETLHFADGTQLESPGHSIFQLEL